MFNNYKKITAKYMKKEKGNTIAIFISLVLTISLITSVVIILNNNMQREYARLKREQGNYDVRLQKIDKEKLEKIKLSNNTKDYSVGRSEGIVNIQGGNGEYDLIEIYSLNQKAYDETFGFKINNGRMPISEDEVLISGKIVNSLGEYYKVGDTIKVEVEVNRNIEMYNYYDIYAKLNKKPVGTPEMFYTGDVMEDVFPKLEKEIKEYKVVGIVDVGEDNVLWEKRILGLLAQSEVEEVNALEVYTTLSPGASEEDLANEIGIRYIGRTLSSNEFGVEASDVKYPAYNKAKYESVLKNPDNIVLLSLVSLFILAAIYNAFHISVSRKLKYYGVLRAVGATMNQISYLIIKEAMILFLISIPFGIFIGIGGLKLQVAVLNNILGINNVMDINLSGDVIFSILLVVLITITIAVTESIFKEGRITPIEAISGAMNIKRTKKMEAKNLLGQSIEDNENDDGELEIKKILDFDETTFKYKVMKKIFKFEGAFAHKNISRNPSQNRLCIITLTSTMLMLIFFLLQTINGNIRSDFARASNLWDINYTSEVTPFTDENIKDIEKIQGVNGVYKNIQGITPIIVDKNRLNEGFEKIFINNENYKGYNGQVGLSAKLRGIDEKSLECYKDYILEGTLDINSLDNNGVILVNSVTNYYLMEAGETSVNMFIDMEKPIDYKVGEEILIPLSNEVLTNNGIESYIKNNNKYKKVKVVAIISEDALSNNINRRDINNLNSNVNMITSEKTYDSIIENTFKNQLYISTDMENERVKTVEKLEELAGENYYILEDNKVKQEEMKKETLEELSYKVIFGVTVILLVVLNLVNTLTANILSRKGELAALSAIGMSYKQKNKMIIAESFYIGFASALVALGTGGVLGVAFQSQNGEIGKVSISMLIVIMLLIVGILVFITLIISIVPLKKLKNLSIVDTLKEDL